MSNTEEAVLFLPMNRAGANVVPELIVQGEFLYLAHAPAIVDPAFIGSVLLPLPVAAAELLALERLLRDPNYSATLERFGRWARSVCVTRVRSSTRAAFPWGGCRTILHVEDVRHPPSLLKRAQSFAVSIGTQTGEFVTTESLVSFAVPASSLAWLQSVLDPVARCAHEANVWRPAGVYEQYDLPLACPIVGRALLNQFVTIAVPEAGMFLYEGRPTVKLTDCVTTATRLLFKFVGAEDTGGALLDLGDDASVAAWPQRATDKMACPSSSFEHYPASPRTEEPPGGKGPQGDYRLG